MNKIDFKKLARDYIWFGWIQAEGQWYRLSNDELRWTIKQVTWTTIFD